MRRSLAFVLLVTILTLTSCIPRIAAPTAILSATPASTPTSAPQTLAGATDLPAWVGEYVHAYGDRISVNNVEMDTARLTAELIQNPESYTRVKTILGQVYPFIVVNDIPLAFQDETGQWQAASMAKLGEFDGVEFECSLRLDDSKYQDFLNISEKVLGKKPVVVLTTDLDVTSVFGDFSETDWQKVLGNWETISAGFSSGTIPTDFPYNWQRGLEVMDSDVVRAFGGDPQYRVQQLYSGGLRPEGERIEALKQFRKLTPKEEMLKIFEFTIRTRVLRFPEFQRWDVSDEISSAYVMYRDNNVPEVNFWGLATGLSPAELTMLAADWVKQDNPQAKTYITEADIFDTGNKVAAASRGYFFDKYIPAIIQSNTEHQVDGVIGENNWWVYEPQDFGEISEKIDYLTASGLEIGGSETMIVSGETPINFCCGRHKLVKIENPNLAQAEMYATWLDLYLDKGIRTIGFGNIDDFYAWTQDVNLPDANPTLFDIDFHAKPAYYALVQVLYEHLP